MKNKLLTIIPVGATSGAIDGITGYITDLFTDAGAFIWLAIGIPLGFLVIHRIIKMMPKK